MGIRSANSGGAFVNRSTVLQTTRGIQRIAALLAPLVLVGCVGIRVEQPLTPLIKPPALGKRVIERELPGDGYDRASLADWVDYALAHNPSITAALSQYTAATQDIEEATALPDPRLSFRYFVEPVETRVGPQRYAVGVSQPLPWLGKLRTQGAIASAHANAAAMRVASAQNAVIAEVANAWYALFYLRRAQDIMAGNRDLVQHLEEVARIRYQTGSSRHPDVVRAQLELGKLENELASLVDRRVPLVARLNAALHRHPQAPVSLPTTAPLIDIKLDDEAILSRVVNDNPDLRAQSFKVVAARASKSRAEQAFYPDFSVGVDYIATDDARMAGVDGSGDDPLAAVFSMTVPVRQSTYRAGVKAAEARTVAERAALAQQTNALEAQAVGLLFRLRDARRQVELYQTTLLPKAQESLVATQQAYSGGLASFVELIDAQRALLVFELAEARAITDHHQARVKLESLIGGPLSSVTVSEVSSHD